MATPIAPTPTLKGKAAKRFIEEAQNPPKLEPVKILTKREVAKIFREVGPQKEK